MPRERALRLRDGWRPMCRRQLVARGALAWLVCAGAVPGAPPAGAREPSPTSERSTMAAPVSISLLLANPRAGGDNLYFRAGCAVLQRIRFDAAAGGFVEAIHVAPLEPAAFAQLAAAVQEGGFERLPTELPPAEPGSAPERIRITTTEGAAREARVWAGGATPEFAALRDRLLAERAALLKLPPVRRSPCSHLAGVPPEAL